MLAAAHVLAMDSKNLLDVVDAVRSRHPLLCPQSSYVNDVTPTNAEAVFPQENTFHGDSESFHSPTVPLLAEPVPCSFVRFPVINRIQQATSTNKNSSGTSPTIES